MIAFLIDPASPLYDVPNGGPFLFYAGGNLVADKAFATYSEQLGIPSETVLVPFLRALVVVRNICAHHGRIYARLLAPRCPILKSDQRTLVKLEPHYQADSRSMFPAILALLRILPKNDSRELSQKLNALLENNLAYPVTALGFPKNWIGIIQ